MSHQVPEQSALGVYASGALTVGYPGSLSYAVIIAHPVYQTNTSAVPYLELLPLQFITDFFVTHEDIPGRTQVSGTPDFVDPGGYIVQSRLYIHIG